MIKAACFLLVALLLRDERVDAVLAKRVKNGEPGAAVLVIKNTVVVLSNRAGFPCGVVAEKIASFYKEDY